MGCVRFLQRCPMTYSPLNFGLHVQKPKTSRRCLTHPANVTAAKFYSMEQSGAQHALHSPRGKSALKGPFLLVISPLRGASGRAVASHRLPVAGRD